MSAQHTPGRLEYGEDCDSEWWITQVGSIEQIAYTVPTEHGDARDVARRLVACWNACEGIRTEALEHRAHLLKAEDDQIAMLTTQRDELLAALRRLSFAALCRDSTSGDPCRLIEVKAELAAAAKAADAAIAKATGQEGGAA